MRSVINKNVFFRFFLIIILGGITFQSISFSSVPFKNIGDDELAYDLFQIEKQLMVELDRLKKYQVNTDDLEGRLSKFTKTLSVDQKKHLQRSGAKSYSDLYSTLSASQRKEWEDLFQYVNRWDYEQHKYQMALDGYSQLQLDYLIDYTQRWFKWHLKDVAPRVSYLFGQNKLEKMIQRLDKHFYDYKINRMEYGQGKDFKRMYPYREYFEQARKLSCFLANTFKHRLSRSLSFDPCLSTDLLSQLRKIKAVPHAISTLKELYFPTKNSRPFPTERPLVRNFNKMYDKLSEVQGFSYNIVGVNNLDEAVKMQLDEDMGGVEKQLIIFVGSHRDEVADPAVLSQGTIGEDHMIFFAAYNVLPQFLAKKLDESDPIIVVGGSKDVRLYDTPLDKIFEKMEQKRANKILIFSQGSTSIINEVHPVREKSSWGLYEGLRSRGYNLIFVPFTIDSAPRFLSDNGGLDDKHVDLKFHAPISSYTYPLFNIFRPDNHQMVNRYFRAKWTENIKRYPHMDVSSLQERVDCIVLDPLREIVKTFDIEVELDEL